MSLYYRWLALEKSQDFGKKMELVAWLEAHDSLSGWAQFFGAMLALVVTYLTAFAPTWRRKRQLRNAGARLLANGYEAIESYHRTSEYGELHPLPLRQAAITMGGVADEMTRFPIYELDDQGTHSLARALVAMGMLLNSMRLAIETLADTCELHGPTEEDRESLRDLLKIALTNAEALLAGKVLARPDPADFGLSRP